MKIVRLFDGGTKMAKNKKDLDLADSSNLNQIKKSTNVVFNILFVILALTCIIPVVFIFIISITSELN